MSQFIICLLLVGVLLHVDGASASIPSVRLNELNIEDTFVPVPGSPSGTVSRVRGRVMIAHGKAGKGFWAKEDYPLFQGDRILTGDEGTLWAGFNDGSIMLVKPETELVLTKLIYQPEEETRSALINFTLGTARFLVKKLKQLRLSQFRVKTSTVVLVVRGSDFIVETDSNQTRVVTLKDTRLEVSSLTRPKSKPLVMKSYERIVFEEGVPSTKIEKVAPAEVEELLKEHSVPSPADQKGFPQKTMLRDLPETHEKWSPPAYSRETETKETIEQGLDVTSVAGLDRRRELPNESRGDRSNPINGSAQSEGAGMENVLRVEETVPESGSPLLKVLVFGPLCLLMICSIPLFIRNRLKNGKQPEDNETGLPDEGKEQAPAKISESDFIGVLGEAWKTLIRARKAGDTEQMKKIFRQAFDYIESVKQDLSEAEPSEPDEGFLETIDIFEARWNRISGELLKDEEED